MNSKSSLSFTNASSLASEKAKAPVGRTLPGIRKGILRPQSAKPMQIQSNLKANPSQQDLEQTEAGGAFEESLMETQKPLLLSMSGEIPDKDVGDALTSIIDGLLPQAELSEVGELIEKTPGDMPQVQAEQEEVPPNETETVNSGSGPELFVCFSNEKELRDPRQIQMKTAMFQGIIIKVRKINDQAMENVLHVIEMSTSIHHLRIEEAVLTRNASTHLSNFMRVHMKLDSLGLVQIKFEDQADHKKVLESIAKNGRLKQLVMQQNTYYDIALTEAFKAIVQTSRFMRELDLSWCDFRNSMLFYHLMEDLERSRVLHFKLRGFQIGKVEGKIMHKFVSDCKTLQSLDISHAYGSHEHFEFLGKFGSFCYIKNLTIDGLETDISQHMPQMGKSFGENTKLEVLNMREQKAKSQPQVEFWRNFLPNRSIKVMNLEKNRITDKVVSVISEYIQQEGVVIAELNLSKNQITGRGIKDFAIALSKNSSLKKLWLTQNELEEEGLDVLAASLTQNYTLEELYLSANIINNAGIYKFSQFLPSNRSLNLLDLSRNQIGSQGLVELARALKTNGGLVTLNLHKNKEINDDDEGLKELAECIRENCFLKSIDVTGIKITKLLLKQHFLPALENNIFIQKIIGRISPGIITDEVNDNIVIESDIIGCLIKEKINNSVSLSLKHRRPELLRPAIKMIKCQNIEWVDMTNMSLTDEQVKMIASFLTTNPSLKKLVLSQNVFISDYGMIILIDALRKNQTLQCLSIMQCTGITNLSLETLYDLVKDQNMTLYKIDLDESDHRFNMQLAISVVAEAHLNKSIQKNLLPQKRIVTNLMTTIDFEPEADNARHFDSVVKVWRIMRPNYIEVCDQNLEDEHILKFSNLLMTHLSDMYQIILRRNKIGDLGAEALATFIARNEKNFTYLEISRNEITNIGATKILEAMKKNTRITTLLIDFGNKISVKIAKKIDKEVIANQHIGSFVFSSLVPTSENFGKLSIKDKGRYFLRCTLKAVSELSILQLELSDNLLTFAEAKKIAKIVQSNYPLRVLNLSFNLLDSNSAEALSIALQSNSNLLELNLSHNRIGDQGVAMIVLPIAKQRLRALRDITDTNNTHIRLQKVSLSNNEHTDEALKHVYACLFADMQIVIDINNPKDNVKQNLRSNSKNKVVPNSITGSPQKSNFKKSISQKNNPMGLGRFGKIVGVESQSPTKNNNTAGELIMKELLDNSKKKKKKKKGHHHHLSDQEEEDKKEQDPMSPGDGDDDNDAEEGQAKKSFKLMRKSTFTVSRFCCGVRKQGASKQFFLLRFLHDLKENESVARQFKCNENILSNVETVSQRYITIFIYLSTFFFYCTALLIPFNEEVNSCKQGHNLDVYYYYLIYAVLSAVIELILMVYLQRKVDDKEALRINKFHVWKIVGGQLARASFFTDLLFAMQIYDCGYMPILAVGVTSLCLLSSYNVFMLLKLFKHDDRQLLQNIERNCKLAYITDHQALAVILDSFSLSNFQTIGSRTLTIPKIISTIKSLVQNLPQFLIQVCFILIYSKQGVSQQSVLISILLGFISFCLSLHKAITAKTSSVDIPKVEGKIRLRYEEKQNLFAENCKREQEEELDEIRQQMTDRAAEIALRNKEIELPSFLSRLSQVQGGQSYLVNGQPVKASEMSNMISQVGGNLPPGMLSRMSAAVPKTNDTDRTTGRLLDNSSMDKHPSPDKNHGAQSAQTHYKKSTNKDKQLITLNLMESKIDLK